MNFLISKTIVSIVNHTQGLLHTESFHKKASKMVCINICIIWTSKGRRQNNKIGETYSIEIVYDFACLQCCADIERLGVGFKVSRVEQQNRIC
jgi:hypothetical protein